MTRNRNFVKPEDPATQRAQSRKKKNTHWAFSKRLKCPTCLGLWAGSAELRLTIRNSVLVQYPVQDPCKKKSHLPRLEKWFEGCVEQMGRSKKGLALDVFRFCCREGGGPDVEVFVHCVRLSFIPGFQGRCDVNVDHREGSQTSVPHPAQNS